MTFPRIWHETIFVQYSSPKWGQNLLELLRVLGVFFNTAMGTYILLLQPTWDKLRTNEIFRSPLKDTEQHQWLIVAEIFPATLSISKIDVSEVCGAVLSAEKLLETLQSQQGLTPRDIDSPAYFVALWGSIYDAFSVQRFRGSCLWLHPMLSCFCNAKLFSRERGAYWQTKGPHEERQYSQFCESALVMRQSWD